MLFLLLDFQLRSFGKFEICCFSSFLVTSRLFITNGIFFNLLDLFWKFDLGVGGVQRKGQTSYLSI